jgi:hypothetical protein
MNHAVVFAAKAASDPQAQHAAVLTGPSISKPKKSRPISERLFSLARLTSINSECLPSHRLCAHGDDRGVPYASL